MAAPFGGELGLHLTQSRLGGGLPPYQVASYSIQPFGHNGHGPTRHQRYRQTDRQRSHSIGRNVLQTVAHKRFAVSILRNTVTTKQ